jgi:hypothetical protein
MEGNVTGAPTIGIGRLLKEESRFLYLTISATTLGQKTSWNSFFKTLRMRRTPGSPSISSA